MWLQFITFARHRPHQESFVMEKVENPSGNRFILIKPATERVLYSSQMELPSQNKDREKSHCAPEVKFE